MNKGKLMKFLSVMVFAAMLLASFAMIQASGQAKASTSTLTANLGVPVVPGAPRNLVADRGPGFVWLWWDHPLTNGDQLIKNYTIWRGNSSGSETLLTTIHVGATHYSTPFFDTLWLNGLNFYNDTTAIIGPTYFYKIVAVSDSGSSVPSNEVSVTPSLTGSAPDAPSASGVGMTYSARVNWTGATVQAGSPPSRFFYLFREGGFLSTLPISSSFGPSSYVDEASFFGAQLGELNNYTLMAANTYGQGAPTHLDLYVRGTGSLPSPPLNLTGFGGNHTVYLSWERPINPSLTGFDEYDVFRANTVGGAFHMVNTTSASFLGYFGEFFDSGLTNGTTYQYEVRANNSHGGVGPFSNLFNVTPNGTVIPMEVSTLNAYPGNNKVLLTWSNAYNSTNYSVWRSESSGTETLLTTLGDVDSYLDTTALNGHTYFYKVKPMHDSVIGPFSPEANATASTGSVPDSPVLVATPSSDGVYLYAPPVPVTDPIIGFHVWREGVNIANKSTIQFNSGFTWSDPTSLPSTNYNYNITAENLFGVSAASNGAISFMSPTGDRPDPITTIGATGQSGGIAVSWNSPTYEGTAILIYYEVLRNDTHGGWQLVKGDVTDLAGNTQWTDHGVIPGVTYTYKVLASNQYGDAAAYSPNASAAAQSTNRAPSAPQNVAAVGHNGYVILTWTAPSDVGNPAFTRYDIYRGANAGSVALIGNVTAGTLTFNDTTVTNGVTYVYAVKAVNTVGPSVLSNVATATPSVSGSAPGAPTGLVASSQKNRISLTWTAPTNVGSGISNYLVYRGTTAGGEASSPIAMVTLASYNDRNATPGTPYYYVVRANNTYGTSPASNEATAAAANSTAPSAPQNFQATAGPNKVVLTWTAPADDGGSPILGYKVFRNNTGSGYSQIGTTLPPGTLTYTDTSGVVGYSYSYYVVAINSVGSGTVSPTQNATPEKSSGGTTDNSWLYVGIGILVVIIIIILAYLLMRRRGGTMMKAPSAPQSLTAMPGPNKVTLAWTAPADNGGSTILNYKIYRSHAGGAYSEIGTVPAGTLSYVDTSGVVGEKYAYYVVASNQVGVGAQSMTQSATPKSP